MHLCQMNRKLLLLLLRLANLILWIKLPVGQVIIKIVLLMILFFTIKIHVTFICICIYSTKPTELKRPHRLIGYMAWYGTETMDLLCLYTQVITEKGRRLLNICKIIMPFGDIKEIFSAVGHHFHSWVANSSTCWQIQCLGQSCIPEALTPSTLSIPVIQ